MIRILLVLGMIATCSICYSHPGQDDKGHDANFNKNHFHWAEECYLLPDDEKDPRFTDHWKIEFDPDRYEKCQQEPVVNPDENDDSAGKKGNKKKDKPVGSFRPGFVVKEVEVRDDYIVRVVVCNNSGNDAFQNVYLRHGDNRGNSFRLKNSNRNYPIPKWVPVIIDKRDQGHWDDSESCHEIEVSDVDTKVMSVHDANNIFERIDVKPLTDGIWHRKFASGRYNVYYGMQRGIVKEAWEQVQASPTAVRHMMSAVTGKSITPKGKLPGIWANLKREYN